jgi:hypothetical protein
MVDDTDVSGRLRPSPFPHHAAAVHRLLLEHTTASVELDHTGSVAAMEPGIGGLLGLQPVRVLDHRFVDLIVDEDRQMVEHLLSTGDQTHPNVAIRFHHGRRSAPISLEATLVQQGAGHRIVLADVLSWRMVERGAAEVPNFGDPADHSSAFVLRLDQQCRPLKLNQAWTHLAGPSAAGDGLEWLNAFDLATMDAFRDALPGMCNGSSFGSSAYIRGVDGHVDRFAIAACSLLTSTREFSGFLVVGCAEPPLNATESLLVSNTVTFRESPATTPPPKPAIPLAASISPALSHALAAAVSEAQSSSQADPSDTSLHAGEAVEPTNASFAAEPDPMTRLAIASVLAAARSNFSGFADDEPGLFDAPSTAEEIQSLIEPIRLDPHAKADLIDHLDAYHEDGMDSVVTVALLFIDIASDPSHDAASDSAYEQRVLERRLRTAVRDHEYAAPLDGQGFVVAARGTFTQNDLEALALRLISRLEAPLRGYGSTGGPIVSVTGVCSEIGETDEELLIRAEFARHETVTEGKRLHLIV